METPTCPGCQAKEWTGTYRAQVERWWSVGGQDIRPRLDYEDEDNGEWSEIACGQCRGRITGVLRDRVLSRLLGAE